ncbi:NUDIX hydrolase [Demetria terragena]|uniref:NUDIX hydrolase n=1 Tax=Demetria terragena TaxID=63959 RepID=UPI00036A55CC|nr:NUDIX hydrolase [Demetria terragena]
MKIEANGLEVGYVRVEARADRPDTASIWCEVEPAHRGKGLALDAARTAVEHALGDGGFARIEAYVDAQDRAALRLASRVGMRREGLARGYARGTDGERRDHILVARLADDPLIGSGEMFRATLNAGLPRTRTIAQGLVRNARGEVLLAELVYKRQWDLPGGVVDPKESPAVAVVREMAEELQVDAVVQGLITVTWLPPWRGWDDALLYLFDVASADGLLADRVAEAVLERREIKGLHWADRDTIRERCAPYTARLIEHALDQLTSRKGATYLENAELPDWAQR